MATMMKTQYRKTEVAWWEEERKATAAETPFFDLADFAREKRREEEYQSALVDVFEQIALSPKPRKHEPPKEEPKNDLVNLPDIYAVAQTAPAPIVDWPLIDDHHRNKNTNPFLEDELMGKKERLLDQAIDSAKADTIFLGAFSEEPVTLPPKTAPLVFESPKERKKQEKLARKKEKQARKNSKKAAKYADSLDSRTLFASDSVAVTHVKKGTGKTKRGRIQITGKDEIDDFPDTEPELRDTLDMMLPPAVIRKEYTGSSSSSGNSSEDDVVQWWNEDVPKEKKTRDVAARRKRTGSAKEVDNSELEARSQRKRALSLPLSRSHGSLKSTKEERLKEKEIRRREKEEAKMKEKEAKLKEKEAAKVKSPRKLSGKEKRALVPSYNAESSMAY